MIEVDQYQFIRHAYAVEGLSQRGRQLGTFVFCHKKGAKTGMSPLSSLDSDSRSLTYKLAKKLAELNRKFF